MKRAGVLFLFLFLLCGCSDTPKEIERGLALRSSVLQGQGCRFDAKITADYGDSLQQFSVSCESTHDGAVSFTVTAPESIAGITGIISETEGKLTFDGLALQFDKMAEGTVSPVSSPWIFLKTLRSGYLRAACQEGDLLRLTIDDSYEDDALQLDIWLGAGDLPVKAEILFAGRRILTLDVGNFTLL